MNAVRRATLSAIIILSTLFAAAAASADDQIYFSAVDNVTDILVQHINAETVRLDISSWYLMASMRFRSRSPTVLCGRHVPVRVIGDRAAPF